MVAELGMVPNQPLRFADSPDRARSEDDLIAYTRVKHFATKDDTWLVRLAMVKSGVRAWTPSRSSWRPRRAAGLASISSWWEAAPSAAGPPGSWRRWTRVAAIIPMVIDALNSEAVTRHHFEAYGFFSPALGDYVRHGLFPTKIGTPEYRAVLAIEDPYNYRDRPQLRMPKFLINAAGDQFFLPDNSRFYYRDLPEEKHLRYVPNANTIWRDPTSVESIIAFYQAILDGTPRHVLVAEAGGRLDRDPAVDIPAEVNLWQASNPEGRDFRVDTIGRAYRSTKLRELQLGRVHGECRPAGQGIHRLLRGTGVPRPRQVPVQIHDGGGRGAGRPALSLRGRGKASPQPAAGARE